MEWIAKLAHAGTLLIVNALMAALSSAIFLTLYWTLRKGAATRGVLLWAFSHAAIGVGFGLLILPAFHVRFDYGLLIGNLAINVGTVLALLAVRTFLDSKTGLPWLLFVVVAALELVEISYVFTGGADFRVMVILGCSLRGIVTFATGVVLWRCIDDARRTIARIAAVFHFIWAIELLARMAWWVMHPYADRSHDPTLTFGLLSRLLLTWVITPSVLGMLTRQLDAALIRYAHQDPLTGVANRRVIWEHGERHAADVDRQNTSMAVLMIDVDHFKQINDRWGHHIGDRALIAIAGVLVDAVRPQDVLARVGGEEFMVLVKSADESSVVQIAESLRLAIESHPIALPTGDELNCTASIGYHVSTRGQAWDDMVIAADQALYTAKREGRNRVMGSRFLGSDASPGLASPRVIAGASG